MGRARDARADRRAAATRHRHVARLACRRAHAAVPVVRVAPLQVRREFRDAVYVRRVARRALGALHDVVADDRPVLRDAVHRYGELVVVRAEDAPRVADRELAVEADAVFLDLVAQGARDAVAHQRSAVVVVVVVRALQVGDLESGATGESRLDGRHGRVAVQAARLDRDAFVRVRGDLRGHRGEKERIARRVRLHGRAPQVVRRDAPALRVAKRAGVVLARVARGAGHRGREPLRAHVARHAVPLVARHPRRDQKDREEHARAPHVSGGGGASRRAAGRSAATPDACATPRTPRGRRSGPWATGSGRRAPWPSAWQ